MADATDYSFDLTPPFRSSLAALGGAAKQDDAAVPPNPVTMATATNWNHFARLLEGFAKFVPFIAIRVDFPLGVPTITSVISMRSTLTTASFVAPTDNGNGDTTISWAAIAAQFPPANLPAWAIIIDDGDWLYPTCDTTVANEVRVKTRNSLGTPTDVSFVVYVYGK